MEYHNERIAKIDQECWERDKIKADKRNKKISIVLLAVIAIGMIVAIYHLVT